MKLNWNKKIPTPSYTSILAATAKLFSVTNTSSQTFSLTTYKNREDTTVKFENLGSYIRHSNDIVYHVVIIEKEHQTLLKFANPEGRFSIQKKSRHQYYFTFKAWIPVGEEWKWKDISRYVLKTNPIKANVQEGCTISPSHHFTRRNQRTDFNERQPAANSRIHML